jgi:hypothetical protein
MDAKGRPIDIFSFVVAYWQTFDNACLKQVPSNGSNKPKLLHDTIKVRAIAHLCKLDLSSLTNEKKFRLKKAYLLVIII